MAPVSNSNIKFQDTATYIGGQRVALTVEIARLDERSHLFLRFLPLRGVPMKVET